MISKKTMWALGLCATLVLPVAANAVVSCPTGAGITCTPNSNGVECVGEVTSDQSAIALSCNLANATSATCFSQGIPATNSVNLTASHDAADPVPASCTWSCNDGSGSVPCTIDQDDGLPVTLQKFSVD